MDYEKEICYREEILARVSKGEKITSGDRLWLVTHRIINRTLGYPYLNTDILHLCPNVNYSIRVKLEKLTYPCRIIPCVTVPGGKGKIVSNSLLTDFNGNKTPKKNTKMLGLLLDSNHRESEFVYQSTLGLLGTSYECDYFDDKLHVMTRMNSCAGTPNFAMLTEVLAENRILYRCKSPISDDFESFVFSIEWKKAIKNDSLFK